MDAKRLRDLLLGEADGLSGVSELGSGSGCADHVAILASRCDFVNTLARVAAGLSQDSQETRRQVPTCRDIAATLRRVARTPAQRGPFGRWLTRVREERYRTQADALAEYRRLAGLSIAPSEYAQWEAGSRVPNPENPKVLALYDFYGSRPAEEPVEPEQRSDPVIAALDRQTEAIVALADVLRQERHDRDLWERELLKGLHDLLAAQKPLARSGGRARSPRGRARSQRVA